MWPLLADAKTWCFCNDAQDFAEMDIEEITKNMETRRTRIFLLMEEVSLNQPARCEYLSSCDL